jgi:hypothetical protein
MKGSRGGSEVQYPWEGVYPLIAFEVGAEATYVVEGSEPACGTGLDWVRMKRQKKEISLTCEERLVVHLVCGMILPPPVGWHLPFQTRKA